MTCEQPFQFIVSGAVELGMGDDVWTMLRPQLLGTGWLGALIMHGCKRNCHKIHHKAETQVKFMAIGKVQVDGPH